MKTNILRLLLVSVLLGTAVLLRAQTPTTEPATAPADSAAAGEKFYGAITAVDAQAMTFSIGDQTFTVNSDTQMTKAADDSKATIADATVGEPARGTYAKSADGKLTVTKVRFGKKPGGGKGGGGKAGGKKNKDAASQPAN